MQHLDLPFKFRLLAAALGVCLCICGGLQAATIESACEIAVRHVDPHYDEGEMKPLNLNFHPIPQLIEIETIEALVRLQPADPEVSAVIESLRVESEQTRFEMILKLVHSERTALSWSAFSPALSLIAEPKHLQNILADYTFIYVAQLSIFEFRAALDRVPHKHWAQFWIQDAHDEVVDVMIHRYLLKSKLDWHDRYSLIQRIPSATKINAVLLSDIEMHTDEYNINRLQTTLKLARGDAAKSEIKRLARVLSIAGF